MEIKEKITIFFVFISNLLLCLIWRDNGTTDIMGWLKHDWTQS